MQYTRCVAMPSQGVGTNYRPSGQRVPHAKRGSSFKHSRAHEGKNCLIQRYSSYLPSTSDCSKHPMASTAVNRHTFLQSNASIANDDRHVGKPRNHVDEISNGTRWSVVTARLYSFNAESSRLLMTVYKVLVNLYMIVRRQFRPPCGAASP